MENSIFTFIINDTERTFTILGSITGEEENNLISQIANMNGIELRRQTFDSNQSTEAQIRQIIEVNPDYRFVATNDIIPSRRFIDL